MKNIVIILSSILLCGCFGSSQPRQQILMQQCVVEDEIDSLAVAFKESGRIKSANGDDSGAIEDYTKAIEISPNYSVAYSNRGNAKVALGDIEGAINDYDTAIKINPSNSTAYYNRAIANAGIGKTEKAISDYSKSVEIDPLKAEAYYGRAFEKDVIGDYKGAIADYSKTIEIDSLYISAYLNRGVTKHEMEDYLGEISDYRLGIKMCINTDKKQSLANLYNNLGRILYDLKRFKESTEAYGDGIKCFPDDYKLYYGRGLARNQSGDKKGACEDWRKSSNLGCFEANALLPLCDDCETDKTKK